MTHHPLLVYVLLDAPDDRVEAALDAGERTARHYVEQGEPWLERDRGHGEDDEALLEGRLVWRAEITEVVALLRARGPELEPIVSRARAAIAIEADLAGLSELQEAVLATMASIDPGAAIVTALGAIVVPKGDRSAFPIPTEPRRRAPTYDGGVDGELFRALCARGLLEVGEGFDADAAAASWAESGREETGESLMEWLIDRADVEEIHASEDDLERAMAHLW